MAKLKRSNFGATFFLMCVLVSPLAHAAETSHTSMVLGRWSQIWSELQTLFGGSISDLFTFGEVSPEGEDDRGTSRYGYMVDPLG